MTLQQSSSLILYASTIFRFWYVCSRLCDTFRYLDYLQIRIDVWLFVCLYSLSCCRFLFRLILNRKLLWIFEFSLAPLRKRPIFLLFVFSLFLMYWYFRLKQKQKRKSRIFDVFARKRTFLSQIKCWFSVIYGYIGQVTPHTPTFGTRMVGQLSSENFLFFLFLFFCKILWFCQFSFSTEFLEFLKVSYLLLFLHKVS